MLRLYGEGDLPIVANDLADERGTGLGLNASEVEVISAVDGTTVVVGTPDQ